MKIPNNESAKFNTVEGRCWLMQKYGGNPNMFMGVDSEGCTVCVSFRYDGIVVRTNQKNGWVRVNFYDENGFLEGESYDGRWIESRNE